jgi:hypothetical protein
MYFLIKYIFENVGIKILLFLFDLTFNASCIFSSAEGVFENIKQVLNIP